MKRRRMERRTNVERSYRTVAALLTPLLVGAIGFSAYAKPPKPVANPSPVRQDAVPKAAPVVKTVALGATPKIVCDKPTHNFGEIWMGPKLKHTYVIHNKGSESLVITKVKPSCGCTKSGSHPAAIAPGESGEFSFIVDSKKLRGRFQKSVTISSNDPETPNLRLTLAGIVKRFVDVLPGNATFGKISLTEPQERVLKITNNTDNPLELSLTKDKDGPFTFNLEEKEKGKRFELTVRVAPPYSPGRVRGKIDITTNIGEQKSIPVNAHATIPERLDIQPAAIVIDPNRPTKNVTSRPIRLTNYGANAVKVVEATSTDPKIKVALNERTAGRAYTITLDMPAGYKPPDSGAKIVLKTDDKEKPELVIPVSLRQTPKRLQAKTAPRRPAEEMVGKPIPRFSLTTTTGKVVSNATAKEQVTVLDFFAVNCGFCKKQIPRLETVRKKYESKGVRFITVSQTMRKPFTDEQVKAKINSLGFKGELAIDSANTVGPLFKATSYPTMVVLGKKGRVGAVNIGNVGDLESRLGSQLDALLAGKVVPTIAAAPRKPQPKRKSPDDLVGKPAPKFSLSTTDGKSLSNETIKKEITVLDFFAVNCGFCKKQLPRVEQVRKEYESKGVRFVAVSQTMRKPFTVEQTKAKLTEVGFKGELAINTDNTVGRSFNTSGFPTMVILGKSGKVEAANVGNLGDLEKRMKAQLDALIAGKPMPKFASAKPRSGQRPAMALVGKPSPKFNIKTKDGKLVANSEFAKYPATVLNFVAPNCGFCKRQVPNVEKVRAEYEAKGIRFVNVALTMRKEYSMEDAFNVYKGLGSNLEFAHDPKNIVGGKFKAVSFPTMVVVDKNGKIAHVNIGAKKDMVNLLKGQLDGLMKKKG